jgi:hypothetical protein
MEHKERAVPRFLIEREIPNAASLSPAELAATSQNTCEALRQLGPQIQWLETYVTQDKFTCVYIAPDAAAVREHARLTGLPANSISEIHAIIDPTTAEAPA